MDVFSRLCSYHQCVKYTHIAIAAHFCRLISVSVGAKFRRFLQYFVFVNDSLSLSNLASRSVTGRVLGRSDLSVAGRVSLGFGCLSSRGGSYASLDDNYAIHVSEARMGLVSHRVAPFLSVKRAWDSSVTASRHLCQ